MGAGHWTYTPVEWVFQAAVFGSIFLGIPAVFVNLLRLPLMVFVFNFCQSNRHNIAVALVGTFIMYELPVGLLVMRGPANGRIDNYPGWFYFFAISLPWLLGSLWATWSLRHELAMPVEEE